MCLEIVRAYGFAWIAMVWTHGAADTVEWAVDQKNREHAAELFVRQCVWQRLGQGEKK